MPYQKQKTLKGFSLGEVVLSIAVLTVGLLPILGAMNGAFITSRDSQDAVIAAGLAQEGAELVVNVKDNSALSGNAFVAFPYFIWYLSSNKCRIQYDDAVLTAPTAGNDIDCLLLGAEPATRYDLTVSGGFYKHTGDAGKFKRRIYLDVVGGPSANPPGYEVVSAVYWGGYGDIDTIANLRANCTIANNCVYSEAMLRPWK